MSGSVSKAEIRCYGLSEGEEGEGDIILRPVFSGGDGDEHVFSTLVGEPSWSSWYDITSDTNAPGSWGWSDVDGLDCDVESDISGEMSVLCSKVELRVTYGYLPLISNPFPVSGSKGVVIFPVLNISVVDLEGDSMNISWLSNCSGSWQVFGTNLSVGNGTYHQTFSNASVNGGWWYWKVNVSDGTVYNESNVFSFYTGFESKIENTGSTNISGYLCMQVHFYSGDEWVSVNDTVNETSPRIINAGEVLGLDTIFNGLVCTNSLGEFGDGTYRVYAAFRDLDGDVLVCDDESLMVATYEFTFTGEP
jgi:hypothetical protein